MAISGLISRKALLPALFALACVPASASADYLFTKIDVVPSQSIINVRAINNAGEAAGFYVDKTDPNFVRHGFLVDASGTVKPFDIPGASTAKDTGVTVTGLSNSGVVAGTFYDANNNNQQTGYTRDALGAVTTFSVTGATLTEVNAVNASSVTAGEYIENAKTLGFLRDALGNVTTVDPSDSKHTSTVVRGLSDSGFAVGDYTNTSGHHSGFIRDASGNITTFNPAGSTDTIVDSVNKNGVATGYFFDSIGQHGFVRDAAGIITPFNVPGAKTTSGNTINDQGVVVGSYSNGGPQGYLRNADGSFITNLLPSNALAGIVSSINSSGQISGYYTDVENGAAAFHGFIGTPRAVPEPASLALLGLGAAGLIGACRRRRTPKG